MEAIVKLSPFPLSMVLLGSDMQFQRAHHRGLERPPSNQPPPTLPASRATPGVTTSRSGPGLLVVSARPLDLQVGGSDRSVATRNIPRPWRGAGCHWERGDIHPSSGSATPSRAAVKYFDPTPRKSFWHHIGIEIALWWIFAFFSIFSVVIEYMILLGIYSSQFSVSDQIDTTLSG